MANIYTAKRPNNSGGKYTPRIQNALEDAMNYASTPDEVMNGDPAEVQQKYPSGNVYGNLDRGKYFDRLESNLRDIGDTQGVMKVQQERDQYQANQNTIGKGSAEVADKRLQYLGPLAQKALTIYKEQGPDAANQYYQAVQGVALDMGLMNPKEHEDSFDPNKAQVVAEAYSRMHGRNNPDALPYKVGTLQKFYEGGKQYQGEYGGMDAKGNNVWKNKQVVPEKGSGGGNSKLFAQKILQPFKDITGDIDPETGTSMRSFILGKVTQDIDNGSDPIDVQKNVSDYIDEYNTNLQAALNAKKQNQPGLFDKIKGYLSGSGSPGPAAASAGWTPAQQKAFSVLRANPKNKSFSDDQLKAAVKQRVK